MFGNKFTALLIQVNGECESKGVWEDVNQIPVVQKMERFRVSFYDLSIMLLQSEQDTMEPQINNIQSVLFSKYNDLARSRRLKIEVCPNIAKNTYLPGNCTEEEVDSVECIRMSLVFHGYSDILPFLSILNYNPNRTQSPPNYVNPRPNERPQLPPRPQVPMMNSGSPRFLPSSNPNMPRYPPRPSMVPPPPQFPQDSRPQAPRPNQPQFQQPSNFPPRAQMPMQQRPSSPEFNSQPRGSPQSFNVPPRGNTQEFNSGLGPMPNSSFAPRPVPRPRTPFVPRSLPQPPQFSQMKEYIPQNSSSNIRPPYNQDGNRFPARPVPQNLQPNIPPSSSTKREYIPGGSQQRPNYRGDRRRNG